MKRGAALCRYINTATAAGHLTARRSHFGADDSAAFTMAAAESYTRSSGDDNKKPRVQLNEAITILLSAECSLNIVAYSCSPVQYNVCKFATNVYRSSRCMHELFHQLLHENRRNYAAVRVFETQ